MRRCLPFIQVAVVAAVFAVSARAEMRVDCAGILTGKASQSTRSFINLLRKLLSHASLDASTLDRIADEQSPVDPLPDIDRSKISNEELHAYKIAFSKIIEARDLNWDLIRREVAALSGKALAGQKARAAAKEVSAPITVPKVLGTIATSSAGVRAEGSKPSIRSVNGVARYFTFGHWSGKDGYRTDYLIDLSSGSVSEIPFHGIETISRLIEYKGRTLAAYPLDKSFVVFDIRTGKKEWEVPYKKIDKKWPDFVRDRGKRETEKGKKSRDVSVELFLGPRGTPQVFLGWASDYASGTAKISLPSQSVTTGAEVPKLYRTNDRKKLLTSNAVVNSLEVNLSVLDAVSGKEIFKRLVKRDLPSPYGSRQPDTRFYEAPSGDLCVAMALRGLLYVRNVSRKTESVVLNADESKPSIGGFVGDGDDIQVVWAIGRAAKFTRIGESNVVREIDFEFPEYEEAKFKVVPVPAGGFLIEVRQDDHDGRLHLSIAAPWSGQAMHFELPPQLSRFVDAYQTGDGRIEAIFDTEDSFVKVQLYGP